MVDTAALFYEVRGHWLLCIVVVVIFYMVTAAIYNVYFSPLAHIPGPFLAKISAFPNFYHATTGYRHVWIWQCHEIYGDAFRFHPNGVIVNSAAAYHDIYSKDANVKKGKLYEVWSRNDKSINTLGAVDKVVQTRKRRTLTQVFSEKSLKSSETFIIKHLDRWCELLVEGDGREWSTPKNMAKWCDYLVFDILGDLCFGKSFESKEPQGKQFREILTAIESYMSFMYPITQSPILNLWVWLKPRGLNYLLECITPKEIKSYYNFVETSVMKRTQLEKDLENSGFEQNSRKDMFHYLFQAKDPITGQPAYSAEELNAEANLLIIAGSGTTSVILSAFLFYVSVNPRVYAKLIAEIRTTFKSADDIHSGAAISSCEYLRACIHETMRMSPAGPSELVREVLPGGHKVDGIFLPERTLVGTSAWALSYNGDYFSDAYTYRPERWIVDEVYGFTAEDVNRAQSAFFPFSAGPDTCVGKNLAMLELMITIGRTLYRFDVRRLPGNRVGGGSPELGWGRRSTDHYLLRDAYVTLRNGPVLQFKKADA